MWWAQKNDSERESGVWKYCESDWSCPDFPPGLALFVTEEDDEESKVFDIGSSADGLF